MALEVVGREVEEGEDAEWPLIVRVEADAAGAGAETPGAVGAVTPPRAVGASGAGAGAGGERRSSRSRSSFLTSLPWMNSALGNLTLTFACRSVSTKRKMPVDTSFLKSAFHVTLLGILGCRRMNSFTVVAALYR